MALNAAERLVVVRGILRCFGEDVGTTGRFLRFLSDVGGINLLANVQAEALVWQPFLTVGLSIAWWNTELQRHFDVTTTS